MTNYAINNQTVESFLYEQASKKNTSTTDYLVNLVMTEIELISVKKDMKKLDNEIQQVNNGTLKLQTLDSLINELDD